MARPWANRPHPTFYEERPVVKFALLTSVTAAVVVSSGFAQSGSAQARFAQTPSRGYIQQPAAGGYGAAGDLDGDGRIDAVGSDFLWGEATGPYLLTPSEDVLPQTLVNAIGLLDIDGDGDLDHVRGIPDQQNRLYRNDGNRVFVDVTAASLPSIEDATLCVAAGDVDGDGDEDLVFGNTFSFVSQSLTQNRLYLNGGNGTFVDVTASHLPVRFDNTAMIALHDVDGDGDLDMFVAEGRGPLGTSLPEQDRLYLNDGAGHFTDATATNLPAAIRTSDFASFGDVDGDGDPDLALIQRATGIFPRRDPVLYLNDGSGVFVDETATRVADADATDDDARVALFDFDDDGDLDMVSGTVRLNDGAGVFTTVGDGAVGLLADFDGDGDVDSLTSFFSANAGGEFEVRTEANWPDTLQFTFEDLNFDSEPDFSVPSQVPVDLAVIGQRLGYTPIDVDGDGDDDIAFPGFLWLNQGDNTSIQVPDSVPIPTNFDSIQDAAVADLDGDGDLDIAYATGSTQGQPVSEFGTILLFNDGSGTFTEESSRISGMPSTTAIEAGDIDGDGDVDLVLANSSSIVGPGVPAEVYRNDGTGNFTLDATAISFSTSATSASLGDLDGDGDLDLIVEASWAAYPSALLWNDGAGNFTVDASSPVGQLVAASGGRLLDVDLDGDVDVAAFDGTLAVHDGAGQYALVTGAWPGFEASTILGDVDRDGDVDLVPRFEFAPVQFNLHGHLRAPDLARVGETYCLRIDGRPGYAGSIPIAIPLLGFFRADLETPFGLLGLAQQATTTLPSLVLPVFGGTGEIVLSIPQDITLVDLRFYSQALIFDVGAASPPQWTNVVADQIIG